MLLVNPEKADFSLVKADQLNWDKVLQLIEHHRFYAPAMWFIQGEHAGIVPEVICERIKNKYRRACLKNLELVAHLQRIKTLFDNEGITFIVIKGPLLSQQLYGDINTRFSGDLDLLIDKKDIQRAHRILLGEGAALYPSVGYEKYGTIYFISTKHLVYRCKNQFRIELHVRLDNNPSVLSLDSFSEDQIIRKQTFQSQVYNVLRDDILLAFLCFHGTQHAWHRLFWLGDITVMKEKGGDHLLEQLLDKSKKLGCRKAVKSAFELSEYLVNSGRSDYKESKLISRFGKQYSEFWLNYDSYVKRTNVSKRFFKRFYTEYHKLSHIDNFQILFAEISRGFFSPSSKDFELVRLPYKLRFFYFVLRPFILLKTILIG